MAKRTPAINLIHCIICDDIRREDNGKFILIGVYPELIMLNMIPTQLILSIWLQFKMQLFAKTKLEFEIRGEALQETIPFTLDIGDDSMFGKNEAIPLIIKLPFNIKAVGSFTFYFRKSGDLDWQLGETFQIKRNTSPFVQ